MIKNFNRIGYLIPIRDRYSFDDVVIGLIILISLFLRFYKLDELMAFIGDQAWFYLSARDMILTGEIPLVGIQTSHPWIHHGAHWTYVLAIILWISKFNPVAPAYFIAVLGVVTVWLLYKVTSEMFSERVGLISALLFAMSPLIVLNARIPYHTSPIPFFVILLFFLTFKLIEGGRLFPPSSRGLQAEGSRVWVFPIITFLLGVLYNHEITTFVFFIAVGIVLGYGFIKKEEWFKKLLNRKILLTSIVSFIIPMIPFILYDISHGYKQTIGFLVWVVWRVVKFPLSIIDKSFASPGSSPFTLQEFFSYYQQLVFGSSSIISLVILFVTIIFVILYFVSNKRFQKITTSYILLFLFLSVALIGLFIHRVPIEADTILISPFIVILTALSILWISRNVFLLALVIVITISISNALFLLSTNFLTTSISGSRIAFSERLEAVDKVLLLSSGKPYNIIGKGPLSDFPVFTMPYEYLLWWKGHAPTKESVPLKIVVWERRGDIFVYEEK